MPVPGTRRTTALVFAANFIPLPLLDTLVQNYIRRVFVRSVAAGHALSLTEDEVIALADESLAPGMRLFFYFLKKLLGKILWPFALWGAVQQVRATMGLGDRVLERRATADGANPAPHIG
jgi:hypothetical protein